jgi:hypothetical protein
MLHTVFVPHRKHTVSPLKSPAAAYGNNRCYIPCSYLTGSILCLHCKAQPPNAAYGNNRCYILCSYLTGSISCLHCKAQPPNAVYGNNRCYIPCSYLTGSISCLHCKAQPLLTEITYVCCLSYEPLKYTMTRMLRYMPFLHCMGRV